MKLCRIEGCDGDVKAKWLCKKHYARLLRHGSPESTLRKANGAGHVDKDGYVGSRIEGKRHLEHVTVAERSLGKKLPVGAIVHHIDGDRSNNAPSNLVICRDRAYHNLLHQRDRALSVSGHADWRKCVLCKQYDAPENFPSTVNRHTACHAKYEYRRKHERHNQD